MYKFQKLQKIIAKIGFICFLFNTFPLHSQSLKKAKIISLINELTPTHSLKKDVNGLEIIGFDVLDENKNHVTSNKTKFSPDNLFYIVVYARKKPIKRRIDEAVISNRSKSVFEHKNGGYFWNMKIPSSVEDEEKKFSSKDWQIGGIYKIWFKFRIPKFAIPGEYKFRLVKEWADHPKLAEIALLDKIKIRVKRQKNIHDNKIAKDLDLTLERCILNPAIQGDAEIAFPWTGNIEYFINGDIAAFKKVIISAKGTPASGVFPLLKILIDAEERGQSYVDNEWKQYEFNINFSKKGSILKIRFDNDGGGPGEDRNMYINRIRLVK